jgi:hypothetical protein
MTNLLLDFGADPNTRTEFNVGYETPLCIASEKNYFEVINYNLDSRTVD